MNMALRKKTENEFGSAFEYWRVTPQISVDFASRIAHAQVFAYVTADARKAEKRPIGLHEIAPRDAIPAAEQALTLSGKELDAALATGDLRAAFYDSLKKTPFFADAEDC